MTRVPLNETLQTCEQMHRTKKYMPLFVCVLRRRDLHAGQPLEAWRSGGGELKGSASQQTAPRRLQHSHLTATAAEPFTDKIKF